MPKADSSKQAKAATKTETKRDTKAETSKTTKNSKKDTTVQSKFLHDKSIKLTESTAPEPDPVHGVGSRDYNNGNAFNGQLLVGTPYRIGVVIGSGHFGQVCLARNQKTNEQLAVKIERELKSPQLHTEWQMYSALNKTQAQGIPKAYYFGPHGKREALVLELLGPSLEQVFTFCGRKFSEQTILLIAVQLITRLEHIHFNSIINRDIKPENFLISKPPKRDKTIFLVDFGIAKFFRDPETKRHIPYKVHKTLTGTPLFMSLHAHMGVEQSRRDELESLGFVLLYFLRGSLPWQSARGKNLLELKKAIHMEELCMGHPPEFLEYMKYVRKLGFEDTPDYYYLRRLFVERIRTQGYDPDGPMDWSDMVSDVKRMRRLQRLTQA